MARSDNCKGQVLITGASRGIGAATAIKLAERGCDVALNYRNKGPRAEQVAAAITSLDRRALLAQADITDDGEVAVMMETVRQSFGGLDVLILNASGGLETGKAEDYAMTLNLTAQMSVARRATGLLRQGGRIVFVTSHWAHFYGTKPVIAVYEPVAKSKRAGEDALRAYSTELVDQGISLIVVSGDAIDGTITPRLLERKSRGTYEAAKVEARVLPSVDEFANAIAEAAMDASLPSGHTIFVGSTEW